MTSLILCNFFHIWANVLFVNLTQTLDCWQLFQAVLANETSFRGCCQFQRSSKISLYLGNKNSLSDICSPWRPPLRVDNQGSNTFNVPFFENIVCSTLSVSNFWVENFIHSRSQFFYLYALGLSEWGTVSILRCQNWDFVSTLGSINF